MLDLVLSVLCSSLIFIVFKLFAAYKVQTLYAIVTNYLVACITGLLFNPLPLSVDELVHQSWFWGTTALGVLFILVFNIMALSSQRNGVGTTSVATKMSLVVPVVFAVLYYNDVLSPWQIIGIALALVAVYLASVKPSTTIVDNKQLWLPLLVFLGSGCIDTCIKYIQEAHLADGQFPIFSSTVFGAAALAGFIFIAYRATTTHPIKINLKNILGGICLGIPNYFSIYFLLRALNNDQWGSASIFTLNNVAIVLFSTLLGILLFKEKLSPKNWGGVVLALLSIVLVALG